MRVSLFSLNLLALGALAIPALLIYQSATRQTPTDALGQIGYPGAMALGAVCLFAAMARLSGRRADPSSAIGLMLAGTGLFAVPIVMLLIR